MTIHLMRILLSFTELLRLEKPFRSMEPKGSISHRTTLFGHYLHILCRTCHYFSTLLEKLLQNNFTKASAKISFSFPFFLLFQFSTISLIRNYGSSGFKAVGFQHCLLPWTLGLQVP